MQKLARNSSWKVPQCVYMIVIPNLCMQLAWRPQREVRLPAGCFTLFSLIGVPSCNSVVVVIKRPGKDLLMKVVLDKVALAASQRFEIKSLCSLWPLCPAQRLQRRIERRKPTHCSFKGMVKPRPKWLTPILSILFILEFMATNKLIQRLMCWF